MNTNKGHVSARLLFATLTEKLLISYIVTRALKKKTLQILMKNISNI